MGDGIYEAGGICLRMYDVDGVYFGLDIKESWRLDHRHRHHYQPLSLGAAMYKIIFNEQGI